MTTRKVWDLDHPPVAVLVDGPRCDALERALAAETRYRVERVSTGADALERLEARPRVDCLWFPERLADGSGVDLAADARERDPDVGLVLSADDDASTDGARLAARATAAGVTGIVRAEAAIEEVVERVESAVGRSIDRHYHAVRSDILEVILTQLELSIFAKDERGRHLLVADKEGGPDPEEAFGKTDLELYERQGDIRDAYEDDRAVVESGEPVHQRLERFDADLYTAWGRTTKVPWERDGETRGLVGITIDISDLKTREHELVQELARLKQFPDYITHDLRNPLQLARGYAELAKEGDEAALAEVDDALSRMDELIEDFQSIANQDEHVGRVEPIALRRFVRDAWGLVSTADATLEIAVEPETTIAANEAQFRPLLENLFKNAVDHAGPDAHVRVGTLEDGFYVADDGPGIPEDKRDAIFEHGHTFSEDGTGTGLSIVRESAMAHEWEYTVTESADGGARFEFERCLVGTPLTATAAGLPIEFEGATDVGDVPTPGTVEHDRETGRITMTGTGENIWYETNEFHYYYATVDDGVRVQGRVIDVVGPYEYTKAGFMVRGGLDEDAAYGYVGATPEHGPEVLWRTEPGEAGHSTQFDRPKHDYEWFRLERLGDRVVCYVSADGREWDAIDDRRIALEDPVTVGLVVSGAHPEEAGTGTFEGVSIVDLEPDEDDS